MKVLIGLALAAVTAGYPQENPQQTKRMDSWQTVQRMCGVIERSSRLVQKHSGQLQEKKEPFRYVRVELYGQHGNTPCCEKLVLAAQAKTDENGSYGFKKLAPGAYWLAIQLDGRTYSYPLLYQPVKHADPDCDRFYLNFDETAEVPLSREVHIE